jgi:sodium pump decarboxylase gamma subunit
MGDEILYGIQVTIIGMGVVFLLLYIISLMLDLMRPLFYKQQTKQPQPAPKAPAQTSQPQDQEQETGRTIAIIAAAISAASGISTQNIKIRAIRRIPQSTPAWGIAARMAPPTAR